MFDFSPGSADPTAFFIALAIRWMGYLTFVGVAIYLGRRVDDWRIPLLAVCVPLVPALIDWAGGELRYRLLVGGADRGSAMHVLPWTSVTRTLTYLGLLSGLVLLSARKVAARRAQDDEAVLS